MATIHVIQGADKGWVYDLPRHETIIGRQTEGMQLSDATVSRHHVKLMPRGGDWLIEDLGSANGTFVNGVRLRRSQPLHQGDQVRVGNTLMVFGGRNAEPSAVDVDIDEDGKLVESAIMASIPSNEDSVIMPTPEAGVQAIQNLRSLYNFISTISTVFDVDTLLNRVLDNVFTLIRPDRGFVLMIDDNGRTIPKAVRHRAGMGDVSLPLSRTIVNHVVSQQVGVLCSNAMNDKRFAMGHSVHDFGIRSAICVPIKGRDRILGVLHVDSSIADHTYSTEQLRLLTAIGYQAGLAVENVQLYESAVKTERLAAVGEAVATLSHHIKNILHALMAGTDLVGMALDRENLGKAREAWPIVTRNLERINGLILNMLAFSKQRQPLLERINVNSVIEECVELVTAQADEKGVAVLFDAGEVPPLPADPEGLHQVLLNLLNNAIDAVERDTGVITLNSAFDPERELVRITVTDNGPGINDETLPHLFEPFYSTKGQKGTGLGLAVARKVVREHGGDLEVTTKLGEGTTFTITLIAREDELVENDDTQGADD